MLKKQTILKIENVYTAHAFATDDGFFVGAGSETGPQVKLYNLEDESTRSLPSCPGGMMSFIPVPGEAWSFVTIMGLFPPFIGQDAGLYLHRLSGEDWLTVKAMDLPFAHRCEFLQEEDGPILVAATVSKLKENPADWSRPGELHVISLAKNPLVPWESVVIDSGITRNHGMAKASLNGEELLFVSGDKGIFSIRVQSNQSWEVKAVFEKEVSEMTFIDLDGDGQKELVTIEPFHGTELNIYKRMNTDWELRYSGSLSFGHGLSSGIFNGEPVIVAGNRSDTLALETITVDDLNKGTVNKKIIESEVGPTQTQVFTYRGIDYILSANQKKHEVALYTGQLE